MSVSVGVAVFPDDAAAARDLLRTGEAALARAADPVDERERPMPVTLLFDALMMGLRLREEGVSLQRLQRLCGLDPAVACAPVWQQLHDEGLLETIGAGPEQRARATPRGLLILDDVLLRLAPNRLEV